MSKRTTKEKIAMRSTPRKTPSKQRNQNTQAEKASEAFELNSYSALFLEEARRTVTVTEGGQRREMTIEEALIRAQTTTGLKGSPYALRNALATMERAEREEAAAIAAENTRFREYKKILRRNLAKARETGDPEPLPHPDDIEIEDGVRPRIVGPISKKELLHYERLCRLRDTLLLQDELDSRETPAAEEVRPETQSGGALILFHLINDHLPERMQLTGNEALLRARRNQCKAKRQLLKELFQAWKGVGARVPRGSTFPSRRNVALRLGEIFDVV